MPYVALRYFNVYGPRMDIHGKYTEVLIRWMERLDAGQPPVIFGDGSQTMDFVYVGRYGAGNVLALLVGRHRTRSVNVGSGVETSLNTAGRSAVQTSWACEPRSRDMGRSGRSTRCRAGWPSTEKARALLGFRRSVTLEEGLSRLVTLVAGASASGHPT